MPIFLKGDMVVKPVEQNTPPAETLPSGTYKWDPVEKRIVGVDESIPQPHVHKREPRTSVPPVVRRNENLKQQRVEQPSNYHHKVDGELHRLINKKSEYLSDMLDFDSNK